jgi:hypothetical protein
VGSVTGFHHPPISTGSIFLIWLGSYCCCWFCSGTGRFIHEKNKRPLVYTAESANFFVQAQTMCDKCAALLFGVPRRDLNSCYRRESLANNRNQLKIQGTDGSQSPHRAAGGLIGRLRTPANDYQLFHAGLWINYIAMVNKRRRWVRLLRGRSSSAAVLDSRSFKRRHRGCNRRIMRSCTSDAVRSE